MNRLLMKLENNRQKEYSGNAFLEVSKDFGSHFSATASLKLNTLNRIIPLTG